MGRPRAVDAAARDGVSTSAGGHATAAPATVVVVMAAGADLNHVDADLATR